MSQEKKEVISGEREITTVTTKKKPPKIIGAVILIAAVALTYYILSGGPNDTQQTAQSNLTINPTVDFQGPNPQLQQNPPPQTQLQQPTIEPNPTPVVDPRAEILAASRRAPSTAFSSWNNVAANNQSYPQTPSSGNTGPVVVTGTNAAPTLLGGSSSDNLASRLQPTYVDGARASLLPDRNYLITKGTIIHCILQTALDSSLPGMAVCEINRDILSNSGKVVLLEKGTKVVGEYRGGLRQGDKRIFVLWTRAETPNGVIINLDSPASDPLGRSGFDGTIDTQFWTRFGGALLLSLVDTGFNSLAALAGQDATNAAKEPAAIALENTGNVPIILRKNQGEEVAIFVNRDLDFSTVYTLRQRK